MEKQIEDILKKHIRTQNSLIDEKGHNHWIDTINALSALLTSEVEKERKEKQKEQEWLLDYQKNQILEEVIGDDEVEIIGQPEIWVRNQLRAEQRKALSELKGGDTK